MSAGIDIGAVMATSDGLGAEPTRGDNVSDTTMQRPTCPKCGSNDVRQWDKVPVPYTLEGVDATGGTYIGPDNAESPVWDLAEFDELMCAACEHSSDNPSDFCPSEQTADA